MGMDITMNAPPTPAEVRAAHLDKDQPDYFRFNWSGMHAMLIAMAAAEVVAEDPDPKVPDWPPPGTPTARKKLLDDALWAKTPDPKLTAREKAQIADFRAKADAITRTHSTTVGRVPAFKFRSNSGWIVAGDEAAIIATKLTAYAARATQSDLDAVNRAYDEAQAKLESAISKSNPGEVSLTASTGLGMSLDEYRLWILEWATYNAVAAKHGGYHVD